LGLQGHFVLILGSVDRPDNGRVKVALDDSEHETLDRHLAALKGCSKGQLIRIFMAYGLKHPREALVGHLDEP
jgi:hypothetical protein